MLWLASCGRHWHPCAHCQVWVEALLEVKQTVWAPAEAGFLTPLSTARLVAQAPVVINKRQGHCLAICACLSTPAHIACGRRKRRRRQALDLRRAALQILVHHRCGCSAGGPGPAALVSMHIVLSRPLRLLPGSLCSTLPGAYVPTSLA